jgi:2-amino-4-hydroxy-6-hydroxymethyldihydropteridine diphosphokinase
MTICYIGIGSNLGNRRGYIDKAIEEIGAKSSMRVLRASSIYETDPIGETTQGKFLNGVLEIETILDPQGLLKELNAIERKLGRKRIIKNGPRTIDLDILYYGEEVVNEEDITIPHPEILHRDFVLRGLKELGRI